jgi:peptide/nickel transport system substrate-binding protein
MPQPRHPLLAAGALAATLLLAGAEGAVGYYESSLPTTMNPLFARSMVDRRTHELVFDRLFYRSAVTAELKSRLIEEDTLSDDRRSITLDVRPGVRWHDDEKLTARDICFTVDAMLDPRTPSNTVAAWREVLESCEVSRGGKTATIYFQRPFHNPRSQLAFPVLPEHAFDGTAIPPDSDFSVRPVGSGPMRGSKGRREVRFTAHAGVHHAPWIPVMRMAEGGDPLVQVRTLLNGGIQGLVSVAPALRADMKASDDVAVKSYDLRSWWFVALNTNRPPLDDPRVRRALNTGLDRRVLRELTMGFDPNDTEQPCQFVSGPFIPSSPYYNRGVEPQERSDKAATAEQMQAAGAVERHGGWVLDGEPVELRIGMHAALDREAKDLLNLVGNQLQEAGFLRSVFKVSNDDWSTKAMTGQLGDDYDLLIGKWSFGVVEDISPLFHTRVGGHGSLNLFNYSDPAVDRLLGRWHEARTDTEAQDAYHALHEHFATDLPYLFLWKLDTKSAWRMEVRNNTITPYYYFTEFDRWSYEPREATMLGG